MKASERWKSLAEDETGDKEIKATFLKNPMKVLPGTLNGQGCP